MYTCIFSSYLGREQRFAHPLVFDIWK